MRILRLNCISADELECDHKGLWQVTHFTNQYFFYINNAWNDCVKWKGSPAGVKLESYHLTVQFSVSVSLFKVWMLRHFSALVLCRKHMNMVERVTQWRNTRKHMMRTVSKLVYVPFTCCSPVRFSTVFLQQNEMKTDKHNNLMLDSESNTLTGR